MSSVDATSVVNAYESNLADYLNKPVHDILARFGIQVPPADAAAASPASLASARAVAAPPAPAAGGAAPVAPAGDSAPFDPTQLIQPVTDALGTLGSGQFGDQDPTKMFDGISQALESAGQSVQQAMSSLGSGWQGDAATAAVVKTTDALAKGAEVSSQATSLSSSLTTVTASVQQAQARLIAIINEFFATLAAIGPSIIFPWGIAAAIAAANQAVTESVAVITETQSTLASESLATAAAGQPVAAVAAAPQALSAAAPAAIAGASGLGDSLGPLMQTASGLASPVMQQVGIVTQAIQSATQQNQGAPEDLKPTDDKPESELKGGPVGVGGGGGGGHAGGGGGHAGGGAAPKAMLQPLQPNSLIPGESTMSPAATARLAAGPGAGMGGSPMMGGPMGQAAKSGVSSGYSAASFLQTSDQLVGDLGNVAPPVIGERDTAATPDVELRI
jgi:uncharacterized protein YukE